MENKLQKKYGLFTAICMVVGIVIGSGVFFKAQDILNYTNGNMPYGVLAWVIGGAVMLICAMNFSTLATRYERVNGLVDYAEELIGPRYAYFAGWFTATIYLPAMTSVLAWVSARYTLVLFGNTDITGGLCMALAAFYLCGTYTLNALAPRLSGKFQISTTIIKLIPLAVMIVAGILVGLINGNIGEAFSSGSVSADLVSEDGGLLAGVVAAAFAYEGWIIATSINAEIKDAKRNLPLALFFGCIIIAAVYILYYIALTGAVSLETLMQDGSPAAFSALLGPVGGTIVNALIVISCLGTLNGLMLACTRSTYGLAARGEGPRPDVFAEVSSTTNMPSNSAVLSMLLCGLWLFYFYGANLTEPIFGLFSFDSSELPIITIYAFYIPLFIRMITRRGDSGFLRGILLPILGILASVFMVCAAIYAHGIVKYQAAAASGAGFSFPVLFYLIVFAVIMLLGAWLYHSRDRHAS